MDGGFPLLFTCVGYGGQEDAAFVEGSAGWREGLYGSMYL